MTPNKNEEVVVRVKDIMSKPVVMVSQDERVDKIAALAGSKKVGSVVVVDRNINPVGMITEHDIVKRTVSRDLKPSTVTAKEIMSKPLNAINFNTSVIEASRVMRNLGIRRLVVIEEKKLIGIISSDDIVKITPELITIISEKVSLGERYATEIESGLVGLCASCENWSNNLKQYEGTFLCEECMEEKE